ncbi:hypothetical protein C8A00DRAFT_19083 [Chaetomidium leptoderma]|uniref:Uncharacterized protein n=1 Tax=Chaetomidium leptoderma TaxID=669021 RepID=A0AAN6ZT80_9PEZI|nr:hypothetical protein C8A00DRAFT_19083 [Chaetomidium leptoderma]
MSSTSKPGVSCPSGGSFYICQNNATEFIGCCSIDPCADGLGECSHGDLRPASFSSDSHSDIPEQECISLSADTKWYICTNNRTTFMGCCHHADPCVAGACQQGYFAPARLSSNRQDRETFIEEILNVKTNTTSTSTSPASVTTTGSGSGSPVAPVGNATSANSSSTEGGSGGIGLHTGAIAGVTVVSTIAAIVALAFLAFKCRCRRGRGRARQSRGGWTGSRYNVVPRADTLDGESRNFKHHGH